MSVRLLFLFYIAFVITVEARWRKGTFGITWDFGCDWQDHDIGNVKSSGEQCGQLCYRAPQCTHFTWTSYEGGTCWLKNARPTFLSKEADSSFVCGYSAEKWARLYP